MGFWDFLLGKKEDKHKEEYTKHVDKNKKDMEKIGVWLQHLHKQDSGHKENISQISSRLDAMEQDMEEIKHLFNFLKPRAFKQLFKQPQSGVYKQTAVEVIQTPVGSIVHAEFFNNLTMMERAIVWVLLNTEMKLSYEDIAALLGKSRSTIRGQVNAIKQKEDEMIQEVIEKNGKKRVFIPDEIRSVLLKTIKSAREKSKKIEKKKDNL